LTALDNQNPIPQGEKMNAKTKAAVIQHGQNLLAIFPNATEKDPEKLCKKLRRLEREAHDFALRTCNGPDFPGEFDADKISDAILSKVNALLGNRHEYQPKTGAKCGCKRGIQRDNCSNCEGTGFAVDFHAIRNRKPLVPVYVNRDARGYALKIKDEWMRDNRVTLYSDWGGYGIIAPDLIEG
jgi:hypothetical protein